MANEEHLKTLKEGVETWNRWREESNEIPNLSYADLTYVNCRGANFSHVNLGEADLSFGNCSGANFTDADLHAAEFHSADVSDASFVRANLIGTNLGFAFLRGAVFDDAVFGLTTFAYCDLSQAKGLELIQHGAPSSVGIDTIYYSRGEIPEAFLRGCGVPKNFITQMHSLISAEGGIQFYSCFISYSSKDQEFARRLYQRMLASHLQVWFAPEDVQGGQKLHEQIERAIQIHEKLLIVLSEASLRSEWVMDELRRGFKAERDTGKRKLFPVRLTDYETLAQWVCPDSVSGKDLAEEVRQYFIPDFSHWKEHDQFEAAFSRLLKDLRAEAASAGAT